MNKANETEEIIVKIIKEKNKFDQIENKQPEDAIETITNILICLEKQEKKIVKTMGITKIKQIIFNESHAIKHISDISNTERRNYLEIKSLIAIDKLTKISKDIIEKHNLDILIATLQGIFISKITQKS